MPAAPVFLTARQAAEALGINRGIVLRAIASGELRARRMAGKRKWFILKSDLNRWAILGQTAPEFPRSSQTHS